MKTIYLPLRADYHAQVSTQRKEKGREGGAWIEVRAHDETAGHPTGYLLLFRPPTRTVSIFTDRWRITSSDMNPLRDDEGTVLARIAEDWVKKRRIITTNDVQLARFVYRKKWRDVLGADYETREGLLIDARRRLEENHIRLPKVMMASYVQEGRMAHAVAEAILAMHTGDGVKNWPEMRELVQDFHYYWNDVQDRAARRAESLARKRRLDFPVGEIEQDAAAIVRDLIKMDAERGDGLGPLDGVGSSSGIVMAAGLFVGGVLLGRNR